MIRQQPNRELPHWQALSAGIPTFLRLATFVLGFFHCFQIYIRSLRRNHSSHVETVVLMSRVKE